MTDDEPTAREILEMLWEGADGDGEEALSLIEGLRSGANPPSPEFASTYAGGRRSQNPDDDCVPWYRIALRSEDPAIVAEAHGVIGHHLANERSLEAIPHLRAAMDSGIDPEPMESALYLAFLVDDPDEVELLLRLALDHPDKEHRGEAALVLAHLRADADPDEAAELARYTHAHGEREYMAPARDLLHTLGHATPDIDDDAELPPRSTPSTGWVPTTIG